jgi:CheY-specific phosphatase CheX
MTKQAEEVRISEDDLRQVVETVFIVTLGLRADSTRRHDPAPDSGYTASVDMSGSWTGSVVLECSDEQARRVAARFLTLDLDAVANDMIPDVLGEIISMISGNLKSTLTPGVVLSTPAVTRKEGAGWKPDTEGLRQEFLFDEGPFWVTAISGHA